MCLCLEQKIGLRHCYELMEFELSGADYTANIWEHHDISRLRPKKKGCCFVFVFVL